MPTLLCYGDSNTHGTAPMAELFDQRRHAPEHRWPGVTAAALGPGWRVIEEGLPGRTTVLPDPIEGAHLEGLPGLAIALGSHRPLELVAIMLGTNDCKARFALPAIDIALGLERLLDLVATSATGPAGGAPRVLVIAPAPLREAGCLAELFEGAAAKAARLAGLYASVAARRGHAFLDAGAHAAVDPLDGVHLDTQGHHALGLAVAAAVADL